jgi:hypothetical protein
MYDLLRSCSQDDHTSSPRAIVCHLRISSRQGGRPPRNHRCVLKRRCGQTAGSYFLAPKTLRRAIEAEVEARQPCDPLRPGCLLIAIGMPTWMVYSARYEFKEQHMTKGATVKRLDAFQIPNAASRSLRQSLAARRACSRHTSVMASPSKRRATKRRRSSITELAFHGIYTSRRTKAESVTHVSGTTCHLCLGPLTPRMHRSANADACSKLDFSL